MIFKSAICASALLAASLFGASAVCALEAQPLQNGWTPGVGKLDPELKSSTYFSGAGTERTVSFGKDSFHFSMTVNQSNGIPGMANMGFDDHGLPNSPYSTSRSLPPGFIGPDVTTPDYAQPRSRFAPQ